MVRVLVVWEPVLSTDWGAPSPTLPAMIADARVVHFYDHDRRLSAMLGGKENVTKLAREFQLGFRMKDVIWDTALLYPPHAPWGAPADLALAPVVKNADRLEAALQ
jgi:2-methylcitrate dehydratase PrpD